MESEREGYENPGNFQFIKNLEKCNQCYSFLYYLFVLKHIYLHKVCNLH